MGLRSGMGTGIEEEILLGVGRWRKHGAETWSRRNRWSWAGVEREVCLRRRFGVGCIRTGLGRLVVFFACLPGELGSFSYSGDLFLFLVSFLFFIGRDRLALSGVGVRKRGFPFSPFLF